MWDKLFNYLNDCGIADTEMIPFEDKDTGRLTMFVPWHLASKVTIADIQPLLPAGWNASASTRDKDIVSASKVEQDYTPSIAIQQRTNTRDWIAGKTK